MDIEINFGENCDKQEQKREDINKRFGHSRNWN